MANLDRRVVPNENHAAPVVAVIGGGYAGLAAAVTLAEAGVRCVLFEAGKTLGGRARRVEYRGEVIDNGQHILAGAYTELLRLMRLVGVTGSALRRVPLRLSMPSKFLFAVPPTAMLPGALALAWAVMTAKGLTFSDRFAAIRFLRVLKRMNFRVDTRQTVEVLLAEQKQPKNLVDHLWQPLTISALNTPIHAASAQVFVNVLRDSIASTRHASDLLLPCVDLSSLFPDPAAAWVNGHGGAVHTGVRINEIRVAGGQFSIAHDTGTEHFDGVIVAVGPHQLAGLLPEVAAPTLRFEPIVTVYFKFDRMARLQEAMLGQARGVAHWFFDRRALRLPIGSGKPAREGDGLIAAVISASGTHSLLSQDELAVRILAELKSHVPDLPPPLWTKVVTEKFATFACTPDADRPTMNTPYPGMFRAGDYVAGDYPATLEGAVRSGVAAAHASISFFQHNLPEPLPSRDTP